MGFVTVAVIQLALFLVLSINCRNTTGVEQHEHHALDTALFLTKFDTQCISYHYVPCRKNMETSTVIYQDDDPNLSESNDTMAEQERLRSESDKNQLLASRAREDTRKAKEELQNVRKSQLDEALLQLSKSQELEKKLEEELLEVLGERLKKSENEIKEALFNESDRISSKNREAEEKRIGVDSEIKKLMGEITPACKLDTLTLIALMMRAEMIRLGTFGTYSVLFEKIECKKVERDLIFEMYERHRMELDRVRSERARYETECNTLKEEVNRLAARIVNYQQDRHEWTKEEQDKLDMKRRIALMTKTSSDQQERCQIEINRLRCENEKIKNKLNSSQTEVVRITQKLEQEEQDKEKLKVKFQESSQASQKELDRLVEEREKLAKEIQTTKTENERLRKELESSQQEMDDRRQLYATYNAALGTAVGVLICSILLAVSLFYYVILRD